jgi:hypothetical protein
MPTSESIRDPDRDCLWFGACAALSAVAYFLLLLAPFLNKPVHIDDANFLILAKGAANDFWRPHLIPINWQGTTERAFDVRCRVVPNADKGLFRNFYASRDATLAPSGILGSIRARTAFLALSTMGTLLCILSNDLPCDRSIVTVIAARSSNACLCSCRAGRVLPQTLDSSRVGVRTGMDDMVSLFGHFLASGSVHCWMEAESMARSRCRYAGWLTTNTNANP